MTSQSGSGTAEIEIFRHYINGQQQEPHGGKFIDRISPLSGEIDAMIALGDIQDAAQATAAARQALQKEWGTMLSAERGKRLRTMAELLREHQEELAVLDVTDTGKPITAARGDVLEAADFWDFYAGLADKIFGRVNPLPHSEFNFTIREPIGVVAVITPWTNPTWTFSVKLAPILACGNTVIVKPSRLCPRSALRLAALCQQAGIPDGVVNIILGDGEHTGATLAKHPEVNHVSFTGNTEIGRQIAEHAAGHLATVSCELSGKSPTIVFSDCDQGAALEHAVRIIRRTQQQIGIAGSRLLVDERIKTDFVVQLLRRINRIRVGPPFDEDSEMSCIISQEQLERIAGYVKIGREEGARLLTGGKPPTDPGLGKGYYFRPTVLDGVKANMRVAQEEIFGPVLAIMSFKDEEEAVRLANATRYGLGAWVFTNDLNRVHRMVQGLEAGVIRINQSRDRHPAASFAGFKESGIGHESGPDAVHTYTRLKNVWIGLDNKAPEEDQNEPDE